MDLRDNTLRQGPPFHISLVLHVLDLLLQCVLVHVSEYTGIHGYSRASLLPDKSRIALAPLRKINRTDYVWGLLLLEHQTYVTDWQQEIRFCEEKCTNFSLVATSARWQRIPILFLARTWPSTNRHRANRNRCVTVSSLFYINPYTRYRSLYRSTLGTLVQRLSRDLILDFLETLFGTSLANLAGDHL